MSNLKQRQRHIIPDMREPSVMGLAYLLRHRELWPPSFDRWNYGAATYCALGLMERYWTDKVYRSRSSVAASLGIPYLKATEIFCKISGGNVQPEDVAEQLEMLEKTE